MKDQETLTTVLTALVDDFELDIEQGERLHTDVTAVANKIHEDGFNRGYEAATKAAG